MQARQIVFSGRCEKFYSISPYVTPYKHGNYQLLLYRKDTGNRVLIHLRQGCDREKFLNFLLKPITEIEILSGIKVWLDTGKPEEVLEILLRKGVLESCGV